MNIDYETDNHLPHRNPIEINDTRVNIQIDHIYVDNILK